MKTLIMSAALDKKIKKIYRQTYEARDKALSYRNVQKNYIVGANKRGMLTDIVEISYRAGGCLDQLAYDGSEVGEAMFKVYDKGLIPMAILKISSFYSSPYSIGRGVVGITCIPSYEDAKTPEYMTTRNSQIIINKRKE